MELLIVDDDGIGFDNRKSGEYLEIVITKRQIKIGIWRKMYEIILKNWNEEYYIWIGICGKNNMKLWLEDEVGIFENSNCE